MRISLKCKGLKRGHFRQAFTARSKALGQEQTWSFQIIEDKCAWLGHSKYEMRIGIGIVEVTRGQMAKDLVGHMEFLFYFTHQQAIVSRG